MCQILFSILLICAPSLPASDLAGKRQDAGQNHRLAFLRERLTTYQLCLMEKTVCHTGMDCRYPEQRDVIQGGPPWPLGSGNPCRNDRHD